MLIKPLLLTKIWKHINISITYNIIMDTINFKEIAGSFLSERGMIDNKEINYKYFLPKNIPSVLDFSNELIKNLANANLCLGELKGLVKNIKNIKLFTDIYKRKEAVQSSKIEGTRISLTDVFLSEAGSKEKKDLPDLREVRNYITSLNFALEKLETTNNIDKNLINHMHYLLLDKVRGADRTLGEYRQTQNWISQRKEGIEKSVFVPPHFKHIESLMEHLFWFMKKSDDIPRLVKIGLMHYYFETIHPYEDGNGRLGRTLILLYFNQLNIIQEPILYLSPFFERNVDEYYKLLMEVRKEGDYSSWLNFFLQAISEVSTDTSNKIRKMIDIHNNCKEQLAGINATSTSFELLDKFFENPYGSIPNLQYSLKRNYPVIQRAIKNLVEVGLIKEYTIGKRNKFYVADNILDILEK